MAWWTRVILGLGAAIVLVASALLYRQRSNAVAALLAVTALISVATPTGIVGYDTALTASVFGVALTNIAILSFPEGRYATTIVRVLVIGNLLWLAVLEEGTDLHHMLDYVCRAAGPALRVEAVSIAVAGEQGRWTIGACHGPVAAGAERWIAGHPSLDDRTTIVDRRSGGCVVPLAHPPHHPPRWREAHDRLDAGRPPTRWHDPDKGVIGLLEDIAPVIGHAILVIEARNGRMAALRAPLLREPA